MAVEEIVVCGPGTAIAGLPEQLGAELGYALRVGRPAALSHLDEVDGLAADPVLRPRAGGLTACAPST